MRRKARPLRSGFSGELAPENDFDATNPEVEKLHWPSMMVLLAIKRGAKCDRRRKLAA
jgi:hypothetical protein